MGINTSVLVGTLRFAGLKGTHKGGGVQSPQRNRAWIVV